MKRTALVTVLVLAMGLIVSPDLNAGVVRGLGKLAKRSIALAVKGSVAGIRALPGQFGSHPLCNSSYSYCVINTETWKREVDNGSLGFPFRRLVGQFGRTPLYDPGTGKPVFDFDDRRAYDNGSARVVLRSAARGIKTVLW